MRPNSTFPGPRCTVKEHCERVEHSCCLLGPGWRWLASQQQWQSFWFHLWSVFAEFGSRCFAMTLPLNATYWTCTEILPSQQLTLFENLWFTYFKLSFLRCHWQLPCYSQFMYSFSHSSRTIAFKYSDAVAIRQAQKISQDSAETRVVNRPLARSFASYERGWASHCCWSESTGRPESYSLLFVQACLMHYFRPTADWLSWIRLVGWDPARWTELRSSLGFSIFSSWPQTRAP